MFPERFRQVEELYHAARESAGAERAALLSRADPELRAAVEALLAQPERSEFLDRPAFESAPSRLERPTVTILNTGARRAPSRPSTIPTSAPSTTSARTTW